MPSGPGKYDELTTYVREQANARGVIVIVFGGDKGSGFSVQADAATTLLLPTLLRNMADEIERSTDA